MSVKRKPGGQPGNKNALGNHGGAPYGNTNAVGHGAPRGNKNAIKHGLYETIILPTPLNRLVVRIMEKEGMEPTLGNFHTIRKQILDRYFPELRILER